MLVLARKTNQNIVIDGCITVKVIRVEGDVVKLGIQAPTSVPVHRQEVYDEIQRNNKAAVARGRRPVPKLADRPDRTELSLEPPDASPAPSLTAEFPKTTH